MKKPPTYHLKVRAYPHGQFVSIWLVKRDGDADSWLLWGECGPTVVEEIAQAIGLKVEREESQINAEKLPTAQASLF